MQILNDNTTKNKFVPEIVKTRRNELNNQVH